MTKATIPANLFFVISNVIKYVKTSKDMLARSGITLTLSKIWIEINPNITCK